MEVKGNAPLRAALERRLVVFTGKGGVGKTSVAAAFALGLSRTGKRVLLAEVRSSRRIPALFAQDAKGDGPQPLREHLTWINFTPSASLEKYAMKVLRFRSVYQAVFERQSVQSFLRAIPALAEILILGYLADLLEKGEYDLAVLDAPSSGPGALMLASPREVAETAPPGPLREGAAWIQRLLSDPARTVINLVVLLEELPVSEAIELYHRLRDNLGLSLGAVFANRTLANPFPPRSDEVLEAVLRSATGLALASATRLLRSRLRLQETYLDRLRAGIDLPVLRLPEVIDAATPVSVVANLAESLGLEWE